MCAPPKTLAGGLALALALVAAGCQWLAPFASVAVDAVVDGADGRIDAGDAAPHEATVDGPVPVRPWALGFGEPGGTVTVADVATDSSGNVYVLAGFAGTPELGALGALQSLGGTDLVVASYTAAGAPRWARSFGSTATETPGRIAVSPAGAVYISAVLLPGTLQLDGEQLVTTAPQSGLLLALDSAGTLLWHKALDSSAHVALTGLAPRADGLVLTGNFTGELTFDGVVVDGTTTDSGVIVRLDGQGAVSWHKPLVTNSVNRVHDVAVDATGEAIFIAGEYINASLLSCSLAGLSPDNGSAGFVARLDGAGNCGWAKTIGGDGPQEVTAVAHAGGKLAVAGTFNSEVDLDGTLVEGAAERTFFAARLAATDGAYEWWTTGGLGPPGGTVLNVGDVALDDDGRVFLAVSYASPLVIGSWSTAPLRLNDSAILAFTDAPEPTWATPLRSYGNVRTRALALAGDDGLIAAGWFNGSVDFGSERIERGGTALFVSRCARASGEQLLLAASGGLHSFTPSAVASDAAGNSWVAGTFIGSLDFAGVQLSSVGLADALLAHFSATGELRWVWQLGSPAADTMEGLTVDADGRLTISGTVGAAVEVGPAELSSQVYVIAFDADGGLRWTKGLGAASSAATPALASAADGALALSLAIPESVELAPGVVLEKDPAADAAVVVASFDADGTLRWHDQLTTVSGSIVLIWGKHVAVGPAGEVAVTAGVVGDVQFLDGTFLPHDGTLDLLAVRYNADGRRTLAQALRSDALAIGTHAAFNADGALVVAGMMIVPPTPPIPSHVDIVVHQLEGQRVALTRNIAGATTDLPGALLPGGSGVTIVGSISEALILDGLTFPCAGGSDVLWIELDAAGELGRPLLRGGTGDETVLGAALAPEGLIVAGQFNGQLDFGDDAKLVSQSMTDGYLARIVR